jgi:orotate phosphoribosyltransferase
VSNIIEQDLREFMRMWVREYINEFCITRAAPGTPPLKSLDPNDYMVWEMYLSRGIYNSKFAGYIGMLFWEKYAEKYKTKPFQIAAVEPRGIAVLAAIISTAPLFDIDVNCFTIREKRKEYAEENIFEGIVLDLPVLIVNDMSNEDNSLGHALSVLSEEGLTVYNSAFTIVNKDVTGSKLDFDASIGPNYPIDSLFSIRDFDYRYNDYISRNERYLQ